MATKLAFRESQELWHWILNSYQTFSMCLQDVQTLMQGCTIGFGIDGYDLMRFLFSRNFFKGKPNPHHHAIKSAWNSFFENSRGEYKQAILSPLAIIELMATIEERASPQGLQKYMNKAGINIELIAELANGIKPIEDLDGKQKRIIEELHNLMIRSNNFIQILGEEKAFANLSNLIEEKKLILLDPLLRSNSSLEKIEGLFNYDKNLFSTGFKYLARKRAKKYSSYSDLYNLLDIYHYILFENSKSILMDQNIDAYITSSGILSRNSWILIKYGEFVSGLNEIPHDWSARTSTVPAFLAIASKHFREDYTQMKDFFEEGRSIARMILRGLLEIPEMKDCHENPHNRKDLFRTDPTINISNEILHLMLSFEKDYYHIVNPEKPEIFSVSKEVPAEEIDLKNLLNWIKDPETQKKAHQTVIEEVNNLTIGIRPLDWKTYIAPIGDDAYEILSTFDKSIDG